MASYIEVCWCSVRQPCRPPGRMAAEIHHHGDSPRQNAGGGCSGLLGIPPDPEMRQVILLQAGAPSELQTTQTAVLLLEVRMPQGFISNASLLLKKGQGTYGQMSQRSLPQRGPIREHLAGQFRQRKVTPEKLRKLPVSAGRLTAQGKDK